MCSGEDFRSDRRLDFEIDYTIRTWPADSYLAFLLKNSQGVSVLWSADVASLEELARPRFPGSYRTVLGLPAGILPAGSYAASVAIVSLAERRNEHSLEDCLRLRVIDDTSFVARAGLRPQAAISLPLVWSPVTILSDAQSRPNP